MHDRLRRLLAAGVCGLLLAAAFTVPAAADSPHRVRPLKAEPRRVAEYRLTGVFTHDTDLLSKSGYAAWMIDELLAATTPLPRLGAAFTRAERDTGINARYLVAHAILETGWGTSWIAQAKHNLFGYGAYDRDPVRFAVRYPTFAAGIASVSSQIRSVYLSPDGRWWRGFPTLRGVNRFYASDPFWADKVAVLANAIDQVIVTLRERGLQFGHPRVTSVASGDPVAAGSLVVVRVPWTSRTLGLPAAIRFAARWTPVALAEGALEVPAGSPVPTWSPVARATRTSTSVDLAVRAPAVPGSWRLEVEARDSDGLPLPATDARPIEPLALRVAAPTETAITVGVDLAPHAAVAGPAETVAFLAGADPQPQAGTLVATIRNVGRSAIPVTAGDGTPTMVEAWSLPLAADGAAVQLLDVALTADLQPGGRAMYRLPQPDGTAVVVLRLAGDPGAIGRSLPSVSLFNASELGVATVTPVQVPDLRDAALRSATRPAPARQALPAGRATPPTRPTPVVASRVPPAPAVPIASTFMQSAPIAATTSFVQTDAASEVAIGLAPAPAAAAPELPGQPQATPPRILVRTLATLPGAPADPSVACVPWPAAAAGEADGLLNVAGVPSGIRLVAVALVPDGGTFADPATLRLAWVRVPDLQLHPTPR